MINMLSIHMIFSSSTSIPLPPNNVHNHTLISHFFRILALCKAFFEWHLFTFSFALLCSLLTHGDLKKVKKCRLFFREFSLQNSPQVFFFFGSEAFQIKRCSKTTPLYLFVYFRKMCFNEEKNVSLFFLKCRFWNVAPFFFFLHFQWFIHKVSSFWQITSYIYKPILESSAKIYHISSSNTTYFFWQTFF